MGHVSVVVRATVAGPGVWLLCQVSSSPLLPAPCSLGSAWLVLPSCLRIGALVPPSALESSRSVDGACCPAPSLLHALVVPQPSGSDSPQGLCLVCFLPGTCAPESLGLPCSHTAVLQRPETARHEASAQRVLSEGEREGSRKGMQGARSLLQMT